MGGVTVGIAEEDSPKDFLSVFALLNRAGVGIVASIAGVVNGDGGLLDPRRAVVPTRCSVGDASGYS